MSNITDHPGVVACDCGTKAFEVKEIGVFYADDLSRCAPDGNGRMRYMPVKRSDEHAYYVLVCVKCAKKFIPGATQPIAAVVQKDLVESGKK